ncbi:glycosyltransferase family 4 protein [Alteromonas sp. W364]|uniref:glycosyltransferase family 4 protein n=1 Tax=Alteromonas sp. W364 TaxID=3075610 RepID=UPI002885916A|nr:glycosyltransferase family 4 protein [Alteromonas sp. W364]MDT0627688.1 glycosyltransferase family 4 protein [Alteromonas sp. W364]
MEQTKLTNTQATKKKVLHITYDMRIGGTEMVIKNIIEGNDGSVEMSIFCIEEPIGPWGKDLQDEGYSIHSKARENGFDRSLITAIRKHVRAHEIDIIHCHQYTPWVYGTLAVLGLSTKVIFTEHGRFYPDVSSWKRRFVNPILSMMTDRITAISEATKEALVEYEFLKRSNIEVVYNGIKALQVDLGEIEQVRQQHKLKGGDFVFGTVARLDPIKNQKMMLNAFARVLEKRADAKLFIVGDGELMDELEQQIQILDIADSVVLTGYIPYPKAYLAMFDVYLLSSLSEGTSMTILEAMSLAKPSIVTDAGGNSEVILNKVSGLVTENNSEKSFSNAMLSLINDTDTTLTFGQNALRQFYEKFEQKKMVNNYLEIYAKC